MDAQKEAEDEKERGNGPAPAKFKQVEIPGKGQGLVATTRLPVGTIVIQESPLFTVTNDVAPFCPSRCQHIVSKFRQLDDKQKNQVLSLHDPRSTSAQGKKNMPRYKWAWGKAV